MKRFPALLTALAAAPRRWLARSEFTMAGGYRDIWHIACPLILMNASFTVMQMADRIFLARNSTLEMAAAPVAGILFFGMICLATVTINFTGAVVAQLHGADDARGCIEAAWSGVFAGLAVGLVMVVLVPLLGYWILRDWYCHEPEVMKLETTYFLTLTPCALVQCVSPALFSYFSGRGKTRVVAVVNVTACAINIVLDYGMIFGKLGFPAMGIRGAGIATALSIASGFLMILGCFLFQDQKLRPTRKLLCCRWEYVAKLLKFGIPGGLQVFFGLMSFNVVLAVIGRIGPESLASSMIALSINNIVFMPLLGISDAASIMVGQLVGSGRKKLAALSAYRSWRMALVYMSCCALIYLRFPEMLAGLFAPSAAGDPEEFSRVAATVCELLVYAAIFGYCDATIQTFSGALRGAGDTRAVFVISTGCTMLIQALGAVILLILRAPVEGIWALMTGYLVVEAAAIVWRFRTGAWRKIRLIPGHEKEPEGDTDGVDNSLPGASNG